MKRCIADGSVGFPHVRVGHRQASKKENPGHTLAGIFLSIFIKMRSALPAPSAWDNGSTLTEQRHAGLLPTLAELDIHGLNTLVFCVHAAHSDTSIVARSGCERGAPFQSARTAPGPVGLDQSRRLEGRAASRRSGLRGPQLRC